jgi:hypothetical protein
MSARQVIIPRFQVLRRGEVIRVVPVHRSRLVVGSEDGAHLRLKHPAIAPRHVEVTVVDGRYLEAANLAGEGRVLLGNHPMNRARLREGDELDLGPVTLRLTYERSASRTGEHVAVRPAQANDEIEDEPTVDAPAPTAPEPDEEPTRPHVAPPAPTPALEDQATVQDAAPPQVRPAAAPVGLGPRPRPFSAADASGVDLDLDEIVLDPVPVVVIEPPGGRPQRVPLRVGSFVVGGGRCAFRLSYPGVAPAHAEMMVMPDGAVYLKHLAGSGLLTLRNGAPIQFSRWSRGDRLQVGPVSMTLQMVPRAAAVAGVPTRVGRSPTLQSEPVPVEEPTEVAAPPPPRAAPAPEPPVAAPPPEPPPAAVVEKPAPPPPPPAAAAPPPSSALVAEPPAPTPSAPPVPPASSLVKVHGRKKSAKDKPGRKLKQSASPLVATHSVQVQLDVSSRDTFRAIADEEIEYRRPLAKRALMPVIILLLLLVILWQAALHFDLLEPAGSGPTDAPRTARGASGMPTDARAVDQVGLGPVTVGDPASILEARRERAAATDSRYSDPGNIDWDDERRRELGHVRSFDPDHSAAGVLSGARIADEIERDSEAAAPGDPAPAARQGFVEMKDIEAAIYRGQRKLRYCYTQARLDDERLAGIMWLTLTLGTDGRIRGVVAEPRSSLRSEPLRACMERQLYALPMPAPTGGPVTFSYPFDFQPSE